MAKRSFVIWAANLLFGILSVNVDAFGATLAGDALFTGVRDVSSSGFHSGGPAVFSDTPYIAGIPSPTLFFNTVTGEINSVTGSFNGTVNLATGAFSGLQRDFQISALSLDRGSFYPEYCS